MVWPTASTPMPQPLSFKDTLFAVDGAVTQAQSRLIVAANSTLIEPTKEPGTYCLSKGFEPSSEVIIPEGVYINSQDCQAKSSAAHQILMTYFSAQKAGAIELLRAYLIVKTNAKSHQSLLRNYHPVTLISTLLADKLGMSSEKISALLKLCDYNLAGKQASAFIEALQGKKQFTQFKNLIERVFPLSILFKHKTFDAKAIGFIEQNPDLFGCLSFSNPRQALPIIKALSQMQQLLQDAETESDTETDLNKRAVETLLSQFDPEHKFANADQAALAQVLKAGKGLTQTLQTDIVLPKTPLEALSKLRDCADLAQKLGVGAEVLKLITYDTYNKLEQASNAVYGALRSQYHDEADWQKVIEPLENKIRGRKRDALTNYLTHSRANPWFASLHDLYHYFLLDVELEGCARTSRVVAATASVQLYVHRVLMNLEQDPQGQIQVRVNPDAISEWAWRKNYRVWEANRKVFLYPENVISQKVLIAPELQLGL
jgi:transcriptional regulator with XRE-family HTH domain